MEINNVMKDVRSAFRLLTIYQQNIVQLVHYMKGQFGFSEPLMGHKLYSTALSGVIDKHASQKVWANMWGWDFLYGYMYEYYTGMHSIGKGNIRMSFIQVSDDGFAISKSKGSGRRDLCNYESVDKSHSYMVMCCMHKKDENDNHTLGCFVSKADERVETQFIIDYLSGKFEEKEKDGFYVDQIDNTVTYVMKKYPIENFIDQESTDIQIRDFKGFVNGVLKEMHPEMEEIFKM